MHIDQDSKENGGIRWKNENPCFENFSGVTVLNLAIKEDYESLWFSKVLNSKYKNGFLTIHFVHRDISRSLSIFEIRWEETEILQFGDFGWE